MPQPTQDTRWQILEHLKKQGPLPVSQLADRMELHPMSVRQHLVALEGEGYVKYKRQRLPRGRPAHVYRLTESGEALFPNNYEQFSLALLEGLIQLEGEVKLAQVLQAQMETLLLEYQAKLAGLPLPEQVPLLADILNQKGYMVEWDHDDGGFILREHHCAIGAIAARYPQVCSQELSLMRQLFGADVERLCHKAKGDFHCSYRIQISDE